MRRHLTALVALAAVLVPLTGCGDDDTVADDSPPTTAPAEDPIAGRTFEATSLEAAPITLVEGVPVRITFGDDAVITVETGCNRLSGAYEIDGPILIVDDLAGTEMACEPDLQAQEEWLWTILNTRPVLTPQAPDGLVISDEKWALRMVEPDEEAAAALVGPTWTADTIIDEDAAGSVPPGVTATISFADDGTYQVSAGCNTGSGTYAEADGGTYQIGAPALTRKSCDADVMEVEAAVVAALDGEVSLSIEADRLTITSVEGAGVSFTSG